MQLYLVLLCSSKVLHRSPVFKQTLVTNTEVAEEFMASCPIFSCSLDITFFSAKQSTYIVCVQTCSNIFKQHIEVDTSTSMMKWCILSPVWIVICYSSSNLRCATDWVKPWNSSWIHVSHAIYMNILVYHRCKNGFWSCFTNVPVQ